MGQFALDFIPLFEDSVLLLVLKVAFLATPVVTIGCASLGRRAPLALVRQIDFRVSWPVVVDCHAAFLVPALGEYR